MLEDGNTDGDQNDGGIIIVDPPPTVPVKPIVDQVDPDPGP